MRKTKRKENHHLSLNDATSNLQMEEKQEEETLCQPGIKRAAKVVELAYLHCMKTILQP